MVCYGCSVHTPWVCSVQPVEGSPTPMDMESNQVTEASSMSLGEIYDKLYSLPHIKDISELRMPSNRRSYGIHEIIYIPELSHGLSTMWNLQVYRRQR